ncbi:MAG: flavodoxin family protein [Chloroflexota bacterium]|nr:flavodoxin family protein [Chloroflexota bacterium]
MKVLAIVGSPRVSGNTEALTRHTLKAIEDCGLETELVRLAGLDIAPCDGCQACFAGEGCIIEDDLQPIYANMKECQGIILASPVYFGSATALIKALMERAGYIARNSGNPLAGKVGSPLVVGRRAGQNFTYTQLMQWFIILGMTVPGASYWPIAFGRAKGEVESDAEGVQTAMSLGRNMAEVVKRLCMAI